MEERSAAESAGEIPITHTRPGLPSECDALNMTEFAGARVVAGHLLRGYAQALARFEPAAREPNPAPAFFALFECLNWAVAVDDFVGKVWRPNGEELGRKWRPLVGGTELGRSAEWRALCPQPCPPSLGGRVESGERSDATGDPVADAFV